MKLVIKISNTVLDKKPSLLEFALTLAELLKQGHRVTVVHGGRRILQQALTALTKGDSSNVSSVTDTALMVLCGRVNKALSGILGANGIPAFGLCGADGNMVRLRRTHSSSLQQSFTAEVASVDSMWLDAISLHGGVPVLANIALGPDGQHHCLDSDQLAGACAAGWNADALIFLTEADGLKNADGSVVRWLEAGKIDEIARDATVGSGMSSKLHACHEALKHGVRRARILPFSQINSLSTFYFSKIEFGTEVIQAV
jgi:acetylglutamate kinase